MFDEIRAELARLNAADVQLEADSRKDPNQVELVKITIGERSCTVQISGLINMLRSLPDGAGENAVETALEQEASHAEGWATC
jgi:hypothetical protein